MAGAVSPIAWVNARRAKTRAIRGRDSDWRDRLIRDLGIVLVIVGVAGTIVSLKYWTWLDAVNPGATAVALTLLGIVAGSGATLLSVHYGSFEWFIFHRKMTKLGLLSAEPTRRGRDLKLNEHWLNEFNNARRSIILASTTLGGWFDTAWNDFQHDIVTKARTVERLEIFLAHPADPASAGRKEAEQEVGESIEDRQRRVFTRLRALLGDGLKPYWKPDDKSGVIHVYTYRREQVSIVWLDDIIYFTPYLPHISNKECPELTIHTSGAFAEQIKISIDRLRKNATEIKSIQDIDVILQALPAPPQPLATGQNMALGGTQ